jgi:hypothetical protein
MTIIDLTGDDFEDDEISLEVELLRGSDLDDLAAVIEDHANDPEVGSLFDSDLDELECDADDAESLEWTPTENLRSPSRTDDRAYDWLDPLVPGGHSDFWSRHPASRAGQSLPVPSGPRNDVTNLSDDWRQLSMCDPWVKRQWQGRTVYDLSEEPQLYDDLGDGFAPAKRRKL